MEKKLYINTVQKCCNYLFAKTQEPVEYEKLITYLENNYEAIILNQKKEFNSNKFVQSINNTLISLNDLTAPIMRINVEDSSLIPLSKDIYAFKHLNHLKSTIHEHDCIEIDFVIEGKAQLFFEKKQIQLLPGHVCIISPLSRHNIKVEKDTFIINIFIRNKILKNVLDISSEEFDIISQFIYRIMLNKESNPNYLLCETKNNQTMQEALKQIILESHVHQDKYSSKIAMSWLQIFIYNILRNFNSSSLYFPIENTYKALYTILNYIENNYSHVTLSDLAKKFHYNEAYLSSLIKKTFNISFSTILKNIKMIHAKAFLINTDMNLDEISIAIGYNSVDHFIRTFTRLNGITPGKYRKHYSKI